MNPYTHAILARQLLPLVNPQDPADYLWGAVVPDIRYLVGMRRDATHRTDQEIAAWLGNCPECTSFIQGYRVHCLVDRIDAAEALGQAFPLRWLSVVRRTPLTLQQAAVVIELYFHQIFPKGLSLVGKHNPILEAIGIREDQSATFANALAGYIGAPCAETAATCFTQLGILENARLEKYIAAYRNLERKRFLLSFLMMSAKNAQIEARARGLWEAAA